MPARVLTTAYPEGAMKASAEDQKVQRPATAFQKLMKERQVAIQEQSQKLPIASAEAKLVEAVRAADTLIVVGETGSGKTTQLPQYLNRGGILKEGTMVGVTQPRRVAAITVATRVAQEMGTGVGQEVGYAVRFEDATSARTRIKYMTDGMLLREALLDPLLQRYSAVVLDEAHERTLHTDVLFALLKQVQARRASGPKGAILSGCQASDKSVVHRASGAGAQNSSRRKPDRSGSLQKQNSNSSRGEHGVTSPGKEAKQLSAGTQAEEGKQQPHPLKLIVMSATLEAERFCEYFDGARAVYVRGRQHPVEVLYTHEPEADYLDAALTTVLQIHLEEPSGDILLFLTGQEEIESLERLLKERAGRLPPGTPSLAVAPIYAALPGEQQMRVFQPAPAGSRKVVLATNIAETSVTIPGIRYVVDPGLVKARTFNARVGVEALAVVPVSKAQARQRSGRAGREGPGRCYRLYTEQSFDSLDDATVPEIRRCNLASVVLQLKALGIDDILDFDFMDPPPRATILKSLEQLYSLGALTGDGKLSDPLGVQMARFPLEPLFSKAVLTSAAFGCAEEMLITVAMLAVESVFYNPKEKMAEARAAKKRLSSLEGDHITLVNVFRAYLAEGMKIKSSSNQLAGGAESAKRRRGGGKDGEVLAWCRANFLNARALGKALDVYRQLRGYCDGLPMEISTCGADMTPFRRCLAASFFLNAGRRQPDGTYRALASGQTVYIHPSSVLFSTKPACVIFNELLRTSRQYIRDVTRIEPAWLAELAPQFYKVKDTATTADPQSHATGWS